MENRTSALRLTKDLLPPDAEPLVEAARVAAVDAARALPEAQDKARLPAADAARRLTRTPPRCSNPSAWLSMKVISTSVIPTASFVTSTPRATRKLPVRRRNLET